MAGYGNPYDQRGPGGSGPPPYGGGGGGGYSGGYGGGGYGGGYDTVEPYSPLNADNYEMNSMGNGYGGHSDDTQGLLAEVDEIRRWIDHVDEQISRIETLHSRSLKDIDEGNQQETQRQLEGLVAETSRMNKQITDRIRRLKTKNGKDAQVGALDRSFKEKLHRYQRVEQQFAQRTREQMARQFRIVRPDATEEEVQAACEDGQGQQIFSQALLNQNRRGEARSALREVQNRHNEIQKIERTIVELAQLFEELNQLVEEQEPMVQDIEHKAADVKNDVQNANDQIGTAIESARARRRKKWWCLLIVLLIIIVIVIIAVVVTLINKKK